MTPGSDLMGVVEEYDPVLERGSIRDDHGRAIPFFRSEVLQRARLYEGDRVGFSIARHQAVGIVVLAAVARPRNRFRRRTVASPTPTA
jgi:hypothetical protein